MIKTLKRIILSSALLGLFAAPLALTAGSVEAQVDLDCPGTISECVHQGANSTDPNAANIDADTRIQTIIKTVINIFSLVVGVVSVIMIIVGGLKYITSGGDTGNVTGAKNTILYAVVGLVVVVVAQVIVRFVLERTTA